MACNKKLVRGAIMVLSIAFIFTTIVIVVSGYLSRNTAETGKCGIAVKTIKHMYDNNAYIIFETSNEVYEVLVVNKSKDAVLELATGEIELFKNGEVVHIGDTIFKSEARNKLEEALDIAVAADTNSDIKVTTSIVEEFTTYEVSIDYAHFDEVFGEYAANVKETAEVLRGTEKTGEMNCEVVYTYQVNSNNDIMIGCSMVIDEEPYLVWITEEYVETSDWKMGTEMLSVEGLSSEEIMTRAAKFVEELMVSINKKFVEAASAVSTDTSTT